MTDLEARLREATEWLDSLQGMKWTSVEKGGREWPVGELADALLRRLSELEQENKQLRLLIYEVVREVPTSHASVHVHGERQRLHRRVIETLGEEAPGEFVVSDYWLGRFPAALSEADDA